MGLVQLIQYYFIPYVYPGDNKGMKKKKSRANRGVQKNRQTMETAQSNPNRLIRAVFFFKWPVTD